MLRVHEVEVRNIFGGVGGAEAKTLGLARDPGEVDLSKLRVLASLRSLARVRTAGK